MLNCYTTDLVTKLFPQGDEVFNVIKQGPGYLFDLSRKNYMYSQEHVITV